MTPEEGGGGILGLGQGSATHPPTRPPARPSTHPPHPTPWGDVLYPTPTVTYKHLIEKPPLAVIWRKDATPCGYLLSPIPQNNLLAMLTKCINNISNKNPEQKASSSRSKANG